MIEHQVIDNFLPAEEHKILYNLILENQNFPWYYFPEISTPGKDSKDHMFYMVHIFYYEDKPNSTFFNSVKPLLSKIDIKSLIRVKGNFYPNQRKNIPLGEPHVDFPYSHKGAIYSINTCNGGTILKDGTLVKSVANRILFFDPSESHDSIVATDDKARVNININYF
jgi:hypothetical protein